MVFPITAFAFWHRVLVLKRTPSLDLERQYAAVGDHVPAAVDPPDGAQLVILAQRKPPAAGRC